MRWHPALLPLTWPYERVRLSLRIPGHKASALSCIDCEQHLARGRPEAGRRHGNLVGTAGTRVAADEAHVPGMAAPAYAR